MERIEDFKEFVKRFKNIIDESSTIVLTAHLDPDGDAIGSALSLCLALRKMGKKADVVLDDIPKVFYELEGADEIIPVTKFGGINKKYDLGIFLDSNDKKHIMMPDEILKRVDKSICIDHHIGGIPYTDILYLEEESPAVCEIVYKILKELKMEIPRNIMMPIIVGVITDTGGFRYPETSVITFEIGKEALKQGIALYEIYEKYLCMKTMRAFEIQRKAIDRIKFYLDRKTCDNFCR